MKRMEVKTCTIGENTYYINPFPAFTAGKAKVRDALGALTGDVTSELARGLSYLR